MIFQPTTAQQAVLLRKEHENSVYLAGGTDDLRLGSEAQGKDLIDLSTLGLDTITEKNEKIYIGACCTLQQLIDCSLIPDFIKQAAGFCASYVRRCSATVGGNLGLRRQDSYLAAAFTAADAVLLCATPHGDREKAIGEYLQSDCRCLICTVVIAKNRKGTVQRFGNTSSSHAAVIAAESEGIFALSVSGSKFAYANHADLADSMTFADDLTGSAAYKKYLAGIAFTPRRD